MIKSLLEGKKARETIVTESDKPTISIIMEIKRITDLILKTQWINGAKDKKNYLELLKTQVAELETSINGDTND
jgi:hypothetical protein